MKNIQIIKASKQDIPAINKIHKSCILEINAKDYPSKVIVDWANSVSEKNIQDQLDNSDWIVARIREKTIGFAQYSIEDGELYQINVSPDFIHQGIGKKLLAYIENEFKEKNILKIELNSTITALDFYKKYGFEVIENINFPLKDNSLEMYRMQKQL